MLGPNKQFVIIYLCIFISVQVFAWGGSGGRGGGGGLRGLGNPRTGNSQKSVYNGLGNANGDSSYNQPAAAARQSPPESTRSRGLGLGLSAWGIVGVLLTFIIGGMAVYYIVLFYPIICKKERKYDIMELSSV